LDRTHKDPRHRCRQEVEQQERLDADPRWRRGRLCDVISARELITELEPILENLLGVNWMAVVDSFAGDQQTIGNFTRCMPSIEAAIALKASYHLNPQHRWTMNDVHDIDALAVPYCEIAFADAAARSVLVNARLGTLQPRHPRGDRGLRRRAGEGEPVRESLANERKRRHPSGPRSRALPVP